MLRRLDQAAAWALLAVGALHIAAAAPAFLEPSERRVWFLSAGLLGVVAGLANLTRIATATPSRLLCLCALAGAASIALIGVLLLIAGVFSIGADPGLIVLAAGVISALFGARDLFAALTRAQGARTAR